MCTIKRNMTHLFRSLLVYNTNLKISKNISNVVLANSPVEINCIEKKTVTEPVNQDVSDITPYFPDTFNIAAYVNKSETLQNLLHLQVNLSKIEKKPHIVNKILKMDFEKDMKQNIFFIKDYVGSENIGKYITKNPLILCEAVDDLQVRINYLQSKKFSNFQINEIVAKNPFWLMFR